MKTFWKTLFLLSFMLVLVAAAAQPVGVQASSANKQEMSANQDDSVVKTLLYTEQKKTASGGVAKDSFGSAVAVYGDTALVGAPGRDANKGTAYILERNGSTWNQVTRLNASDGFMFGWSVALSDNTAVIGAPFTGDKGAVYIFVHNEAGWALQKKLIAPDGAAGDFFGWSVAISGNTVLVGATGDDAGAGSAYIFTRTGTVWGAPEQIWSDEPDADHFGASVALEDDIAVIGAPLHSVGADTGRGAAYVFVRSIGSWVYQQELLAAYTHQGDNFGASVAISDERILVGAPHDDVHELGDEGSVRLFVHSSSGWSERIAGVGNQIGDEFGSSIAVSGDLAIIGARRPGGVGYARVYSIGSIDLAWQQTLKASDSHSQDYYGISVSISGDTALVGASYDDIGSNLDQGSAYFYTAQMSQHLINGGFNAYPSAPPNIPTHWVKNANFSATDGKDTTPANRKEGTASIKIANTTAKTKTLTQTLYLSGTAGDILVFSYWVKGNALPGGGKCQGEVLLYYGTTLISTDTLPCSANRTFAYRQRVLSFRTFGSYNKVVVRFTYSKTSGTVWFDAASLLK